MRLLIRSARTTGLLYLGLAITGSLGFLLIRPRLYVTGDPGATLARLVEHESLARLGIAVELLIVLTQALTAVWFYRLFRTAAPVAAVSVAAFGLVNAVTILASAAMLAGAISVALDPVGDPAATVQLLYVLSGELWGVGALFFGLWLIPMGWCALRSRWMPRPLGWLLVAGGVGYVLSTFVGYLAPQAAVAADALLLPSTLGEFWMISYLLVRGVSPHARDRAPEHSSPAPDHLGPRPGGEDRRAVAAVTD